MTYDIAHRHNQALDPSALNTVTATLHALTAAIDDCRIAGKAADRDPAVLLLARRVGAVATVGKPADAELRQSCLADVAEIRRHPALVTLALKGVDYDADAKKLFHSEGRRAMRLLAEALDLAAGDFDIRSNQGGIAVSGEITLHGDEVYVQLALGCMGHGQEVMFRRVRGRKDYTGDRNHWASIRELIAPDRFADRLRRELGLATPVAAERTRLFA